MILVGLTMRAGPDPATGEDRDMLAQDWGRFLAAAGLSFVPLPNIGSGAVELARRLDLDGLILTGGEDIGARPERDATENLLIDWAMSRNKPILGVCRGFQVLNARFGGSLTALDPAAHRAVRHAVRFADTGSDREVNSYHAWGIASGGLAPALKPLAKRLEDGSVEAASGPGMLGIMWHPEREWPGAPEDIKRIREFFSPGGEHS